MQTPKFGEMAEWSNAHAWKACKVLKPSRVRIPLSPPLNEVIQVKYKKIIEENYDKFKK